MIIIYMTSHNLPNNIRAVFQKVFDLHDKRQMRDIEAIYF